MSKIPIEVIEKYNELKESLPKKFVVPANVRKQAQNLIAKINENRMQNLDMMVGEVKVTLMDILEANVKPSETGNTANAGEIKKQIKALELVYPGLKE